MLLGSGQLMSELHFVFLQGMPSRFFRDIAKDLCARGCKVTGINLCVGDWIFWRGPNRVNYRGKISDWSQFFGQFLARNRVTDVVLLGEQRSYHKLAIAVAKAQGVRVTVTDFGYLRPDWITLEPDGMSGASRFPRDPTQILRLGASVPKADLAARYADSFWKMAVGDLLYSFSNVFLFYLFPHYRRGDKRANPFVYFPAMGWRLLTAERGQRRAQERFASLASRKTRYFVFPLQLEHDFQIVAYSPFDSQRDAIRLVVESFAKHADAGTRLVLKVHPWDPGLDKWERYAVQCAERLGIKERIVFLDGGNLDKIIPGSSGMITVNSTSGLRALQLGCPVKVLGEAIYDVAGLTHQGKLDNFWKEARRPDPALVDAFNNAIAAAIQIRGVFFCEPGLSAAARTAAERLFHRTVGVPPANVAPLPWRWSPWPSAPWNTLRNLDRERSSDLVGDVSPNDRAGSKGTDDHGPMNQVDNGFTNG